MLWWRGNPDRGGGGSGEVWGLWLLWWVEVNGMYDGDGPGRFNGTGAPAWEGQWHYYSLPSDKIKAFVAAKIALFWDD